jgi:selenocysteine-specific elongation factor
VQSAPPRSRVAVNLAGVATEDLRRGQVLGFPGELRAITAFDALLWAHSPAGASLRHGDRLALHSGSAEVSATIGLLGEQTIAPGQTGWARVRLQEPIAVTCRQHFVLRLPSPLGTVGGGIVADLEPHGRGRDLNRTLRLANMLENDSVMVVRALLSDDRPRGLSLVALLASLGTEEVSACLKSLVSHGDAVVLGESYQSQTGWARLRARTLKSLEQYHRENPLRRGMSREELRSKVRAPRDLWNAALQLLTGEGIIAPAGAEISLSGTTGGVGGRRADADRVLAALRRTPFSPPSGAKLLAESGADISLLDAMAREGEVVRLADGVYLAHDAFDILVLQTLTMIDREGSITVARFRDAFQTSRKYSLAILERLDGEHLTRRIGDVRIAGSKRPACA